MVHCGSRDVAKVPLRGGRRFAWRCREHSPYAEEVEASTVQCSYCNGRGGYASPTYWGWVEAEPCRPCHGTGRVPKPTDEENADG